MARAACKSAVAKPSVNSIINRCERYSRLVVATLARPQTGNAEGNANLPEQGLLLAGHFAGPIEAIFGRLDGLTGGLLAQKFAFDAEQLRDIPPVLVLAGGDHRVFQGAERLVEPPCPGKRQRESAFDLRMRQAPPGSAARLERIAQHPQALREVAAFDQQHSLKETALDLPEGRARPGRHIA